MPFAIAPELHNPNQPAPHIWYQPERGPSPLQYANTHVGPDVMQQPHTERPVRALGLYPLEQLFPPGLGDIFGKLQSVGFSEALPDGTRTAVAVGVKNQADGDGGQITFSHTVVGIDGKPVPGQLRSLARTIEGVDEYIDPKVGVSTGSEGKPTFVFSYTTVEGNPKLSGYRRDDDEWIEPIASPSELSTLEVMPIGKDTFVIVAGDKLTTGPDSQRQSNPADAHAIDKERNDLPKELWLARVQNDGSLVFKRMKGGENGETLTDPQILRDVKWGPMVVYQKERENMPSSLMASILDDETGPYNLGPLDVGDDPHAYAGIKTQGDNIMVTVHSGDTLQHAVGRIDPEAVALSTQEGEQQTDMLKLTPYPSIPKGRIQSTRALGLRNGELIVTARTSVGTTEVWALGPINDTQPEGSMRLIGTHSLEAFGINPIPGEMVFGSGAIWAQLGYGENAKGYYGESLLHTQFLPLQQSEAAALQAGAVFARRQEKAPDNKSLNPWKWVGEEKDLGLEPLRKPGQGKLSSKSSSRPSVKV